MTLIQPGKLNKAYTGITLDTDSDVGFSTTVSGYRFLYNGSQFCLLEYDASTGYSELNVWSNDGTSSSNIVFENRYLLDVNYDQADDVYYGIRWNDSSEYTGYGPFVGMTETEGGLESATLLLSTTFSGTTYYWQTEEREFTEYDTNVTWDNHTATSDSWYNYEYCYMSGDTLYSAEKSVSIDLFQTFNSQLAYTSSVGVGYYSLNVDVEGNFVAYIDVDATSFDGDDSVIALRCLRQGSDSTLPYNQMASVCLRGPTGGSENAQGWFVSYPSESAGSSWSVGNLRINERYLDNDNTLKVVGVTSGSSLVFDIDIGTVSSDGYWDGDIWYCGSPTYTTLVKRGPSNNAYVYSGDITLSQASSIYGYGYIESSSDPYGPSSVVYDEEITTCSDALYGYGAAEGVSTSVITQTTFPNTFRRLFPFTGGTYSNPEWSGKIMSFDVKAGYSWDYINRVYTNYFDTSYTSRSVQVSMTKEALGISTDKIRLAVKRVGSYMYLMKRDNSIAGGSYTTICSEETNYSGPVRFEIYADGVGATSNDVIIKQAVVRDLFLSERTGEGADGTVSFTSPVFTVETYDKDGNRTEVPGVSDTSGHIIKNLDLIRAEKTKDGRFAKIYGTVQIATDGNTYGGELYINYGDDIYKYLKSSFPILDPEDGSTASIVSLDVMFGSPYYNTLNFNGYTLAGLIFIGPNTADPGEGVYVNCIRNETITPNSPIKIAWLEESDSSYFLYTTDPNTKSLIFGLSTADRKVYVYDLDEYKAAFTNVVFEEQILGANTGDTCIVKAQVVNVYGSPLEGKSVQFFVSSGDGSVSPASDTTDSLGEATTEYTVGSTVGLTRITAIVTN